MIDLNQLLDDAGIEYKSEKYKKSGKIDPHTKYWLDCLFDSSHTGKDAMITQYDNGSLAYKCLHASCKDYRWKHAIPLLRSKGVNFINYGADDPESGQTKKIKSAFTLTKLADIEFKPLQYLVRPLIPMDSLIQVFGDPGSLKTFFIINIAACVATGTDFHGMFVQQGPVIFIAGEGQNGLLLRFKAWSLKHGISLDDAPIYFANVPIAVGDPESVKNAIAVIDEIVKESGQPKLIVLDTVARNFGPGDESKTRDMNGFVAGCDSLREKYRCTAGLVHHSGHGDKGRGRGAMSLFAALDAEFKAYKDGDEILRVECTKMKEGKKPKPMAFKIESIDLGIEDSYGDIVDSLVLNSTDYEPPKKKSNEGRGKNQISALSILNGMYDQYQTRPFPDSQDSDYVKVKIEDWVKECKAKGLTQDAIKQVRKSLAEQNIIKFSGPYVEKI